MSTAFDVAVSMGGCEAVVESLYSVMKTQNSEPRLNNSTIVNKTIVDWVMPDVVKFVTSYIDS